VYNCCFFIQEGQTKLENIFYEIPGKRKENPHLVKIEGPGSVIISYYIKATKIAEGYLL
jgi:hypothetical protein